VRILLLSTYEMGRQPFGLASSAAWLKNAGHTVDLIDASRDRVSLDLAEQADGIALYLPMHTATVLALNLLPRLVAMNPRAKIAAFGLYAPLNAERLRAQGVSAILGGEFEAGLVAWAAGGVAEEISLVRQQFVVPDRAGLPEAERYAQLQIGAESRVAGYTEASRGCKHLCRHCPIVPVYNGAFRVVQREVVLADVRQQVRAGARHITFGDPDFFNGPGHAVALAEAMHSEFPSVTYDVTIKVEHLLKHRALLPILKRTGCAFVTSAVESVDDAVLERFAKNHTRADFYEAVELMRDVGLVLSPTFVAFTPWTTLAGYRDLLRTVAELGLVEHVAPVQWGIRLLVPAGSLLLGYLDVGEFDPARLVFPWVHPDTRMDGLAADIARVTAGQGSRRETFKQVWELAFGRQLDLVLPDRATVPYLNEPWYC
jgi:radical SAM superfamily enzyme YgiQ (UPF0313 family)